MIYLLTYLFLAFTVSFLSFGRRISYIEVFFISIFLTPIVGVAIALKAENNIRTHHYKRIYTCTSCDYISNENQDSCPVCGCEMETSYNEAKLKLA